MTTTTPTPDRRRARRSEAELIAELEAEVGRLRARAAAKAAKQDPSTKHTVAAVRALDLALGSTRSQPHRSALNEARTVLVAYLQLEGVKIPQRRGPKGRRGWHDEPAAGAREPAGEAEGGRETT